MVISKFLVLFSAPLLFSLCLPAVKADSIVLTATSVMASYSHANVFQVSGPDFSFSGEARGENLPQLVTPGVSFGGVVANVGGSMDSSFNPAQAQLQGFIDGHPALFGGFATTPAGSATVPSDRSELPTVVNVPLTITGSFTACLQPLNVGPSAPCDPAFLNYAVVNVNLPGVYSFYLSAYPSDPIYPDFNVAINQEIYTAALATPEPSSLTLLIAGSLVGCCIIGLKWLKPL